MTQLAILLLSGTAIALIACKSRRATRWGWLIGLAGQPFWIVETIRTGQWGMLLLSLWFGVHYARGAWREWRWASK